MRLPAKMTALALCAVLGLTGALGSEVGVGAVSGDKLTAEISAPGDEDAFALDASEGGTFDVSVKAAKGTDLLPVIRLLRPDGTEANASAFLVKGGTSSPSVKKFAPGDGQTGRWKVVIGAGAGTGGYLATFKVALPRGLKTKGAAVPAGGVARFGFTADEGALVTVTVKETTGPEVSSVRVLGPGGGEAIAFNEFLRKKTTLSVKKAPVAGGFGRYEVEIASAAQAHLVDVTVAVKYPKPAKRKETLPPEASVSGSTPEVLRQQTSGVAVTVSGTGFLAGTTATVSGAGVDVGSVTRDSAEQLTVRLDVAPDAAFGSRDLTICPPALLGEPIPIVGALDVLAPVPTLEAGPYGPFRQADPGAVLVLRGTGLRTGGAVTIPGGGLTLGTPLVSPAGTAITVTMGVGDTAAVGTRDVTYTQPAAGGGESVTALGALTVHHPVPTITNVTPTSLKQGQSGVTLVVTGTGFRSGGAVTVDQSGLTLSNPQLVSATEYRWTLDVAADATFGARDLTYTQPLAGGGDSVTRIDAFSVLAPDPVVASVDPASITQGAGPTTVTVNGTGFRTGGAISFSGTGLTVGSTSFVSATQATVSVTAASDATLGDRDVTWTQPAAGGGAIDTADGAFSVFAPTPTVTDASPDILIQGASGVLVTVTGTNFRTGGAITFSGTGITPGATSVVGPTSATVTVDVAADATVGARDVTFTQPAVGGGASATGAGLVTVNHPTPTVTAVDPDTVTQATGPATLTVTGTGFRDGGALSISGTGLTLGSTTVNSDTEATVDVTAAADATLGSRDVTFTQPAGGGGAAGTGDDLLSVHAPQPTISAIDPDTVTQGGTSVDITLTGTNFRDGGSVSVSGTGIAVSSPTRLSDTSFRFTVTVDSDATLGSRDATYTQPAAGGGLTATFDDALQVDAPTPTVTGVSPTVVKQGQANVTLTVSGTNFRGGGAISISSTGLTVGSTTFVSETSATVVVSAASDAAVGDVDVTWTQPAAGGGASATGDDLLGIHHPDPTLTAVSPTQIRQGESGTLTLTGTNFRSGGTVSISGTGVTLSSPAFVSDTSFTVSYSNAAGATTGARDVTYTQPSAGGGATATRTSAVEVFPPGPQFTSISPSQWVPGNTRFRAVITGQFFVSGTTVGLSGTGITVHGTTFDSSTQLTLDVSVASNASVGARDLTVTPGSGGGPAATFDDEVTVVPAPPTVTAFSHTVLAQGASSVSVTVNGTNFRTGDTLSAGGSGVTFSSVSVTSSTTLTASCSVSGSAATGLRDLTVTRAAAEGGGSATRSDAFRVNAATPTVTSILPGSIGVTGSGGATRRVECRIAGTNFMTGASVSVTRSGGSGITVVTGTAAVVSDTRIDVDLDVTGTATTGTWDVLVSNPGGLGTSGTSGNGALTLVSSTTLAVNRVVPAEGSTYGGERVTVHGAGFVTGAVVDFGSVRAYGTHVIDANTLVTTVPQPTSVSRTARTEVTVKVTNPSTSNASLASGYAYDVDEVTFLTRIVIPAQGATGVPDTLVSACVKLSAPADTTTGAYYTSGSVDASTKCYWFEAGNGLVSNGARGFGPNGRWLVFTRTGGGSLPINAGGTFVLSIPVGLKSVGGNAFVPTRLTSTSNDQQSFVITSSTQDTTAPTLSSIAPTDTSTGQSPTTKVTLTFSEEIDPLTVSTTNITFKQGTTTVASHIEIGDDLKTVTLTPEAELALNTTYTTTITTSVKDVHGNAFASSSAKTFTTRTSAAGDTTNPTVDAVVIEDLPASVDGSGTYDTSSTSGIAFDSYLPRSDFLLRVTYSDEGGSGIDPTSFSAKCSVAVGSTSANNELASNFDVTHTRAEWRIPSTSLVATGDNVTFTFFVKDNATNTSSSSVVTVDVDAIGSTSADSSGGDLDPFSSRQTWILRDDLDAYSVTVVSQTSPSAMQGATTTLSSNGKNDMEESLTVVGLNSTNMTTAAAATVNGPYVGTNQIVRRLVMERLREVTNERYEIDEDGTRDADSVNIEFILGGEQGSLTSMPAYSTTRTGNSASSYSEISVGGTKGAEASSFTAGGTNGTASFDLRNIAEEANINNDGNVGVFALTMLKRSANDPTGTPFGDTVALKFVTVHGGTPIGEHASDDDVLAGTFDRTTSVNSTHNARYDDIFDAIEMVALYLSSTLAHEVGHSVGLIADGPPKTGLFGNAHTTNPFTDATGSDPNTSGHLRFALVNNLMEPSSGLRDSIRTGTEFRRFNPLALAYLRRRLLYDEGK